MQFTGYYNYNVLSDLENGILLLLHKRTICIKAALNVNQNIEELRDDDCKG